MSQIEAIESALKKVGDRISRPWHEWQRDDNGDETWWLHNGVPLVVVIMDEEILVTLTEQEAEQLAEAAGLEDDEVPVEEPSYLAEIYARPLPQAFGLARTVI